MRYLLALALTFLFCGVSFGTDFSVYDEENHHFDEVVNGVDGKDGVTTIVNRYEETVRYENSAVSRIGAMAFAASASPACNHQGKHSHTCTTYGLSTYGGVQAGSVGVIHQFDNRFAVKVGTSFSGGEYGSFIGGSISLN